jgi:hypothetical protein
MEVLRAVKVPAGEERIDARELEPQQLEGLARNVELRGLVGAVPSTPDCARHNARPVSAHLDGRPTASLAENLHDSLVFFAIQAEA